MAKYYYPAIFFPDGKIFGVVIPDLQGCFTQGNNLLEATIWAVDAIGTYLDGIPEKDYPPPSKIDEVDISEYPNAIVNIIEFDAEEYYSSNFFKSVLKNIMFAFSPRKFSIDI